MKNVYLDNNATPRVAPEVVEAITPSLTGEYFNPSSMYEAARGPADAITEARKQIARLLGGTKPTEILFTSCATESNNTAIFGTIRANPNRRPSRYIHRRQLRPQPQRCRLRRRRL